MSTALTLAANRNRLRRLNTTKRMINRTVLYVAVVVVAVIIVMPVYWSLSTSFKPMNKALEFPPPFHPEAFRV